MNEPMTAAIDSTILEKYLVRGLRKGLGDPGNQVCLEAAVSLAMGRPFGDTPPFVSQPLRTLLIRLNDAAWSSPVARANGLRDLAYEQVGTAGVLDEDRFASRVTRMVVRGLFPMLFRELDTGYKHKHKNTKQYAARAAKDDVKACYNEDAATLIRCTTQAAAFAHSVCPTNDKYLLLLAGIALRCIREQIPKY